MSLTKEDQKRISKIGTSALTVRVQLGKFEGEELEYAISLLKKRHVDIDSILAKKNQKPAELEAVISKTVIESPKEVVVATEANYHSTEETDIELLPIEEIASTHPDPIPTDLPIKPIKEKKAKTAKKSGKHEKKLYTDEKGKELTKSDLMRRLIRLKHSIKPKELNDQLIDAGFEKAYHSEIQRCRQQMGVTSEVKE